MTRLPVAPPFLTECPRIRLPTERLTCRGDRTRRIGPSNRTCRWRTRMTVAKHELGRTGLQVTTLGYGAMELRGAPRARDITEPKHKPSSTRGAVPAGFVLEFDWRGLRLEADTWSGCKVNRLIGGFLGQALPSVHFAHRDLS